MQVAIQSNQVYNKSSSNEKYAAGKCQITL